MLKVGYAAARSAFQAERDRVPLQQQRNRLGTNPLGGDVTVKKAKG
jgi:hypothetical protein